MKRNRRLLVVGLFVAFVLAGFISGYASSNPDGLERVAADHGFAERAADSHAFAGLPIADYAVSGIDNARLAGGVAGIIGTAVVFVVGGAIFYGVARLGRGSLGRR